MNSVSIEKAVVEVFEVSGALMRGRSRRREIVDARMTFLVLLVRELRFSPRRAARIVNREHTRCFYCQKRFDGLVKEDAAYRRKYEAVLDKLGVNKPSGV